MMDSKGKYVGAPYNFVPLSETVIAYPEKDVPKQNAADAELLTGEIDYTINAETEIFISDGNSAFYRDNYGRYAIPGSSFRGLIRNNVQILSLSSVAQDVDDYKLMYRNVAKNKVAKEAEKDRYNAILGIPPSDSFGSGTINASVLTNVKAGYIKNEDGKFRIYKTVQDGGSYKEINYYVLSERIINEEFQHSRVTNSDFHYSLFSKDGCILQYKLDRPFRKSQDNRGKTTYIGDENKGVYIPYEIPCSYETSGNKVIAVGKYADYSKKGYAVSTGPMKNKKALYIIPEGCFNGDFVDVPEEDINAFIIDYNRRKNTLKKFGEKHFSLPEPGEMRPVFYYNDISHNRFYFGFTPHLRVFFDHTIKDGMPDGQKEGVFDFTKALFGYSSDEKSRKTRISFSDAVSVENVQPLKVWETVLGEPKPTSYMDYVLPRGGKPESYNSDDFRLRGIKQYWLRGTSEYGNASDMPLKEKVATALNPLPVGTKFTGKVRFKNLRKEELGLLLWAIRLEKGSRMNIGMAKARGFGNITVSVDAIRTIDLEKAYALNALQLNPLKEEDASSLIQCYTEYIREQHGINLRKEAAVETLLKMRDPFIMPAEEETQFMSLANKDYQSREMPLPLPEEICPKWNEKKKTEMADNKEVIGVVKKIDGKKVSVKVCEDDTLYPKFTCENVTFREVTKKELKDVFPEGTKVRLQYAGREEDKDIWKCIGLI